MSPESEGSSEKNETEKLNAKKNSDQILIGMVCRVHFNFMVFPMVLWGSILHDAMWSCRMAYCSQSRIFVI